MEKIIEHKQCRQCQVEFTITDKDLEFYKKISPVFNWEKYSIPKPKLCPDCRTQRRQTFRNERSIYKRKCDATWEDIISIYHPESKHTVYNSPFWWSDEWSATDYAVDIDFDVSFLEQFKNLNEKVPRIAMMSVDSENSNYTNQSYENKNCYMCFAIADCKDMYYSECATHNTDCIDVGYTQHSQVSYNTVDSENLWFCFHMNECIWCNNCKYCDDCISCSNCFGCVGLRNKSYCIFNKQYTKQEYEKIIKTYDHNQEPEEYKKLKQTLPKLTIKNIWCSNVTWNNLRNCNNCKYCFDCHELENCSYNSWIFSSNNCFDCYGMWASEFVYEWISVERIKKSIVNIIVSDSHNMLYSDLCFYSSDCFGCVWVRNKKYCILNKQYTKEEYETLVPKIIEKMIENWEWWEFFPASLSPFGYNETIASEYFPLSKKQALEKWFNWSDYQAPFPQVEKIIPAEKLPKDISDIPDDILAWAIECELTGKPFRIIGPELEFYRKHNLPIPKRHPDQRHLDRMKLRSPRKLYERNCDNCSKDIQTIYPPEKKENIYCEACYNNQI